jgi:hypothetical protein
MAGTVIADKVQAASTSTLEIMNGVALTPPRIEDVNGVEIGTFCRAWVNFNGTGTVAIRASFNVSSITDNGLGDYTVNFTNAMPDANYEANYSCQEDGVGFGTFINEKISGTRTTTALQIVLIKYNLSARVDSAVVNVAIFR